jgi:hypothetical protein
MAKKILFTVLQFLLFLIVFALGSFLHPFHLHWDLASAKTTYSSVNGTTRVLTSESLHYFVPDGLLLAVGVLFAIIVMQALRRRYRYTMWTVVGFIAAMAAAYALRLGFVTRDIF